tara:strand:+ start:149 stop:334 length:186 start_codon:yes stop_codon:yes gene_type:complete
MQYEHKTIWLRLTEQSAFVSIDNKNGLALVTINQNQECHLSLADFEENVKIGAYLILSEAA